MKTIVITNFVTFFGLFSITVLFPQSSFAYIDPGSGSYIFQILIAGILGLTVSVKMFWKQISLTIKKLLNKLNGKSNKG